MIAGGCRCGACRYVVAGDAMPPVYCCHCRDCQTWSGSAFTQQAVIAIAAIEATGPVVTYSFQNPSGATSTQHICGTCHTRLWNTNTARAGIAVVRAGTLDASDTLVPRAHMWTSRKQPWLILDPAIPAWPESPAPAEFVAAIMR